MTGIKANWVFLSFSLVQFCRSLIKSKYNLFVFALNATNRTKALKHFIFYSRLKSDNLSSRSIVARVSNWENRKGSAFLFPFRSPFKKILYVEKGG